MGSLPCLSTMREESAFGYMTKVTLVAKSTGSAARPGSRYELPENSELRTRSGSRRAPRGRDSACNCSAVAHRGFECTRPSLNRPAADTRLASARPPFQQAPERELLLIYGLGTYLTRKRLPLSWDSLRTARNPNVPSVSNLIVQGTTKLYSPPAC